MKGNIFVGRSRELEALHKALRRGSQERALLVTGDAGMGKTSLLTRFWEDIRSTGSPTLWIDLAKLSGLREDSELPTALVESLDGSTSALQGQVASFAQSFGKAIFAAEREDATKETDRSKGEHLAELWTKEFLQAFPLDKSSSGKPLIYVVMDDLDQIRSNLLISFQEEFVEKWQELGVIDSFRFVASSEQWPLQGAAVRFIESVAGQEPLLVRLPPFTENECGELARKRGVNTISGSELFVRTKGLPSHVEDELEMHSVTREPFPTGSDAASLPEGLSDQQKQWVARAACLNSLTVEGLNLFYGSREATEAFNWLRYSSNLIHKLPGRAIALAPSYRQAALDWFRKSDPTGAKAAINRAERLADFQARIPTESERQMLLLLSSFLFFDPDALEAVVGKKADDYMAFVKKRPEWFVKTTQNYQVLPEYRDICHRFQDLMGESSMDQERKQKVVACWERKKQTTSQKQNQLRSEESKLHEELLSVDNQAISLESAREQILNPVEESFASSGKRRRQIKMGTSFGFLALGIVVLGLSLGMRDLFSVYHAAAGIFLTFAGFFWPIVVHEAPVHATAPGIDKFAVETQQRVLQFRLNGLDTRRSKLRAELGQVHSEARNLEEILEEPYLRED